MMKPLINDAYTLDALQGRETQRRWLRGRGA